jgi:tetratricopeptide (TPR) repeat protein|tara:strand:+ start:76 stop:1158 length:1083 start_codon:yes stop_codon:yes gene_type:complete
MKITKIYKFCFFLGLISLIVFLSFSKNSDEELLIKAKTMENIGEIDSSIVLLTKYLLNNPNNWETRLNIARLYGLAENHYKAKLVYKKIINSTDVPDSVFLISCRKYSRILEKDHVKIYDNLSESIKKVDDYTVIKSLTQDLSNNIKSFPLNNSSLLMKIDSTAKSKLELTDLSWYLYIDAIVINNVASKLFLTSENYLFSSRLWMTSRLQPPDYFIKAADGESEYEFIEKHVYKEVFEKFEEFGSYYFENKNWLLAGKSWGFAKEFSLKYNKNMGWSYASCNNAYNEAVSYRNDKNYQKSLKLFKELTAAVPNIDEYIDVKAQNIHKILKSIDPSVGDYEKDNTKTVKQHISELQYLTK